MATLDEAELQVSYEQRLSVQREEISELRHTIDTLKQSIAEAATDYQAMMTEIKELSKVNYPLLILLFSLIPVLGGACLYFVSSQVSSAVDPIKEKITLNKAETDAKIHTLEVIGNMRYESFNTFAGATWQARNPGQVWPAVPYYPSADLLTAHPTADPNPK
jgi:hypothetical protein